MKKTIYLTLLSLLLSACGSTSESEIIIPKSDVEFVQKSTKAHNMSEFYRKEAISFDLNLIMGGTPRIQGKLTLLTNSSKGIFELSDGNTIIYNNGKVYHSPNIDKPEKVRFNAYTWSYFFLFPYKMADKGTVWSDFPTKKMSGTEYNVNKLTFEANTGDAPDDWYVVYTDKESNLVATAAYIVTFSKSQAEAEQNPHAISYSKYKEINNIPIATEWIFSNWNEAEGVLDTIGTGTLSNIKFVTPPASLFEPKTDFIEV